MRPVTLYIAASLDNFIARPDGDVSWLHAPEYSLEGEDYGYYAFYQTVDTTLMGHNTFKAIAGFDVPFPYPDKTNYVFSRSGVKVDLPYVQFIAEDPIEFVTRLQADAGKGIWLIGGGQLNTLFLNHDLIDRLILTVVPITLGAGIPLFAGKGKEKAFQLEKSETFQSGLVQLWYQKKP